MFTYFQDIIKEQKKIIIPVLVFYSSIEASALLLSGSVSLPPEESSLSKQAAHVERYNIYNALLNFYLNDYLGAWFSQQFPKKVFPAFVRQYVSLPPVKSSISKLFSSSSENVKNKVTTRWEGPQSLS